MRLLRTDKVQCLLPRSNTVEGVKGGRTIALRVPFFLFLHRNI
jgi:hypothetical protein